MSDETTLLPCPFCGGEATPKLAPYIGGGGCGYIVDCDECWSKTGYYSQKAEAIEAWNARTASGDDYSRAVHDGHLWQRCDACEHGAVPMTEENMAAHGWVIERTCEFSPTADNPPTCSNCVWQADAYDCDWLDGGVYEYDGRFCKHCGAEVVVA